MNFFGFHICSEELLPIIALASYAGFYIKAGKAKVSAGYQRVRAFLRGESC